MKIKETIRSFLAEILNKNDLADEQDIFALGIVNSLFAMQLVLYLEKEFKIYLKEQDLHFDNLKSVASISCLVEQKLTNGGD